MMMKQLHTKYFPKDLVSEIELRRALNGVLMKKEDDSALLFEQISAIENKFNTVNYRIHKKDRIATILEKAPREYGTVLTVEQRSKGNNLTLEDLYDARSQLWKTLYRDDTEVGEGAEIGLTSTESQLTCYRCKKRGHKAFQCPDKQKSGGPNNKNRGNKFTGKCNRCGKQGHRQEDCWEDDRNANKRPKNYRKSSGPSEVNNVEVVLCGLCKDEDQVEVALIEQQTVEFPQEFHMLFDPKVWIADTGASADSTPCLMGATKIRPTVEGDGVVVGNGQKSQTEQVIDLSGWKCDEEGNKEFKIQMKDVKVVPDNKFNLFSITKRLSSGWKLDGDEKSLWLSKGNNKVVFDLKIKTKEGYMFAMYMQRDGMEVAAVQADTHRKINIEKAHQLLGHMSNETTGLTRFH
jgi:hypothetical protein